MSAKWKIHKSSLSLSVRTGRKNPFEIRQEPFLIKIKAANSNLGAPGEIRNSSPLQFQFTGTQQWATINIRCSLWHRTHNGAFKKAQNPLRWQEQKPCKYLQMDHARRHSRSCQTNVRRSPRRKHSATNSVCLCVCIMRSHKKMFLWHLGDMGVALLVWRKSFLDAFWNHWAHNEGALIMIKFLGGGQRKCRVEGNTCWPTIPTGRQLRWSSCCWGIRARSHDWWNKGCAQFHPWPVQPINSHAHTLPGRAIKRSDVISWHKN
jgi:hypothetical protein